MPNFGSFLDFLAVWPLWLIIGALCLFVYVTRDRKPPRGSNDPFSQQMQDQRRVNGLFNIGAMFGRRD